MKHGVAVKQDAAMRDGKSTIEEEGERTLVVRFAHERTPNLPYAVKKAYLRSGSAL